MNSSAPPPAAAGWYPDPDGTQRYWDGSQWLDIPAPPQQNSVPASNPPKKKRRLGVFIVVGIVLVLALGSGALVYKNHQDKLAAQEAAAIAQAEADALLAAAELELEEIAQAEEEAAAAEEAAKKEAEREKAAETREQNSRKRAVTNIEKSIETMAKDDIKRGFITGEVLDVACVPVAGGSTDNLLQSSTIFECFVSTKDNKDGTFAGFYYKSTMNWEADSYTYEFGQP